MKVLIVSGFLGAGKTSFIRHMTDTLLDVDFVIFENEMAKRISMSRSSRRGNGA